MSPSFTAQQQVAQVLAALAGVRPVGYAVDVGWRLPRVLLDRDGYVVLLVVV